MALPMIAWMMIGVGMQVIGYMLNKPKQDAGPEHADFKKPTAEVNRAVPYAFGTVDVKGPNLIWVGDVATRRVSGKSGGMFSKPRAPAAFYNAGAIFGVCHGPIDAWLGCRIKDKIVFPEDQVESGNRKVGLTIRFLPGIGLIPIPNVNVQLSQSADFIGPQVTEAIASGEVHEVFPKIDGIREKLNGSASIASVIPNGPNILTSTRPSFHTQYADIFGGKDGNGGLGGGMLLTRGDWSQALHSATSQRIIANSYPEEYKLWGIPAPTFRGVATAHAHGDPGMWLGRNDPNFPEYSFRVMRRPVAPFAMPENESWALAERETLMIVPDIIDDSWRFPAANPVAVIWEIKTNQDFGESVPASDMDRDSFIHAARICSREKLGIGGLWGEPGKIRDFIDRICQIIDGVVYTDPVSGKETIRLLRSDNDLKLRQQSGGAYQFGSRWHESRFSPFRADIELHEGNASIVEINRASLSDAVTHYNVRFTNDVTEESDGIIEVDDGALSRTLGIINQEERDHKFLRSPVIARRVAIREMRNKSRPTITAQISGGPSLRLLRPYDVITLRFSDMPVGRYRVAKVDYGSTGDDGPGIEVIDDVFSRRVVPVPDKAPVKWASGSPLVTSVNQTYVTSMTAKAMRDSGASAQEIAGIEGAVIRHISSSPQRAAFFRSAQRDGNALADESWDTMPDEDLPPAPCGFLKSRIDAENVSVISAAQLTFDPNGAPAVGDLVLFVRKIKGADPWTFLKPSGEGAAPSGYSFNSSGTPQDAIAAAAMAMDVQREDDGDLGWHFREEYARVTAVDADGFTVQRGLHGSTPAPLPAETAVYLLKGTHVIAEAPAGQSVIGQYSPVNDIGRTVLTFESAIYTADKRQARPDRPGDVELSAGEASSDAFSRLELEAAEDLTISWKRRQRYRSLPYGDETDDPEAGVQMFVRIWRRVTINRPNSGRYKAVCLHEERGLSGTQHVIPSDVIAAAAASGGAWNSGGLESDIPDFLGAAMLVEVGSHVGDLNSVSNPLLLLDVGRQYPGWGDAYGYSYGGPEKVS